MADQVRLTLKTPVTFTRTMAGGEPVTETVSELVFTEPDGKAMLAMDAVQGEMAKGMAMVAASAGVAVELVHKMKLSDIVAAIEKVEHFLPDGREIGLK